MGGKGGRIEGNKNVGMGGKYKGVVLIVWIRYGVRGMMRGLRRIKAVSRDWDVV